MSEDQPRRRRPSLVSINEKGDVEIELNKSLFPKIGDSAKTIAAIVAVITSVASWFKPQDNTATKASYDTLSQEVKQIADQSVKNHDDLVATKAYLDGFTNRVLNEPVEIPSTSEQTLAESVRENLIKQRLPLKLIRHAVHETVVNPPPVTSASSSPPISPRPAPIKIPDFNAVLEKAKK
jgi:hypothetical protein